MSSPNEQSISYFARTNHRNTSVPFGIRQTDRLSHMYVIGKTGVGKSTLLQTLALQDFEAGRGFALVDPHGDLVEPLAKGIATLDPERLVYLDAADPWQPYGYNPLRRVRDDKISLAVSGLLETLKKLWPDAWGVRMEHVLRNTLYTLLERDDAKLPDILALYSDDDFRKQVVRDIRNDVVKQFWEAEFNAYPARLRAEACAPIQNKLGALLSDPTLYRILVEPEIDLHFRSLMDDGMVLLVNVSKGRLGEDSALLLGSLVVSTLGLAAFSRAEQPPEQRPPFFVYLDEFQNFTTLMLANMMSELRKYGVGLVLAHQYLHQLELDIQHAVLGNAGTTIAFRVGSEDAPLLAKEFQPKFEVLDLIGLPNYSIYLKLMIDGTPSKPFSANAIRVSG
jgi:energy-coupling factor transporter ATP-binding protein EcfA2